MKIAIPTIGAGGLDCERSGHFGHCDCFTVVTVEDGIIAGGAGSAVLETMAEEGFSARALTLGSRSGRFRASSQEGKRPVSCWR